MSDVIETATSEARTESAEALRRALEDPALAWPDVVLREHQIEALDQLMGRLANGVKRTWVDAPTGSGKTIMFSALAAAIGGSALVLVPRRNLAEQTATALARYFPSVTVREGPEAAGIAGVTITTYQAALRHAGRMGWEQLDLVICDEAHTALGLQTRRLLDRPSNALVVGFTATGSTTTGHVEQVFGPVAATLDRQSAIERGILCPLRSLRVERSVDLSDVTITRGDFDQASLGRALDRAMWHRACAEVWSDHFAELRSGRRRLHRHRRPGPCPRRRDGRQGRARRGRLGPDAEARAAQDPQRLRRGADRRALQRRPPDRGLGRDPGVGGDAPGADHL